MEIVSEKFFDLSPEIISFPFTMSIVAKRCAGQDEMYDWSKYDEIDVSIVRSKNLNVDDENSYVVISDNCTTFTVAELAEDCVSDDCNPKVEAIMKFIKTLPVGKVPGKFYVRVTVFAE